MVYSYGGSASTWGWGSGNVAPAGVGYGSNFRMITAPAFSVGRNGTVSINEFQGYKLIFTLYRGSSPTNMYVYAQFSHDNQLSPTQTSAFISQVALDYAAPRGYYYRWGVTVVWYNYFVKMSGWYIATTDRASDFRCNAERCQQMTDGSVWVG